LSQFSCLIPRSDQNVQTTIKTRQPPPHRKQVRNGFHHTPQPYLQIVRGEIATRIISTAREIDIETYSIYVSGDSSHAARATHAIEVSSAAVFMNIDALIVIVKKNQIDAVHPGYGFLSESEVFAERMWKESGAVVVGPGWGILAETGDKLRARELAERCEFMLCC
jgi:pyruvate carboxylase